jgi:hypothetical protein
MQAVMNQVNNFNGSLGLSINRINRARHAKPARKADITTSMVALDLLTGAPNVEHLFKIFNMAHKTTGTTVRLPWVNDLNQTSYSISVCFSADGGYPVWKLKRGFGAQATDIFVHKSGDVELIYSLLRANFY